MRVWIAPGLVALAMFYAAPAASHAGRVDACALNRLAFEARDDIRSRATADRSEHFSLIYVGHDGLLTRTPALRGMSDRVTFAQIEQGLAAAGIGPEQMIAFVHNHPAAQYGFDAVERGLNRYPSGDLGSKGDWRFARWLAERGAGGAGGRSLFLYVIDTRHDLRRFDFVNSAALLALSDAEMVRGRDLPPAVTRKSVSEACGLTKNKARVRHTTVAGAAPTLLF